MSTVYTIFPESYIEHEEEFERIQNEVSRKRSDDGIDLEPPDLSNKPGLSMPMDSVPIEKVSMVAVHKVKGDYKFVHVTESKMLGKYTVFLIMGKNPTFDEKLAWTVLSRDYYASKKKHKNAQFNFEDVRVFGVMTRSYLAVKSFVEKFDELYFPVIADSNGELCRAFGVMNVTARSKESKTDMWGASKAIVILNKEMKMCYLSTDDGSTDDGVGIHEAIDIISVVERLKAIEILPSDGNDEGGESEGGEESKRK